MGSQALCFDNSSNEQPETKILIVDDLPENLRALQQVLEDVDAQIVSARSGKEAVAKALRDRFALIILDVMMPEMDGFETASLLRVNETTKQIPIIFMTAIAEDDDYVFQGYELGAVDYLCKPINAHSLNSKVNVFLQLDKQKYQLQSTLEDVQRLENRNKLLLKSVGEGILGIDAQGMISFSNPAAERILGRNASSLEQTSILDILYLGDSNNQVVRWNKTNIYQACFHGAGALETIGVFWNAEGQLFPVEFTATPIIDQDRPVGIVIAFQDITERQRTERQLAKLAQFDSLTGLNNRFSFGSILKQTISRCQRNNLMAALIFLDLDHFKQVNDSLGHEIGDFLLQEVASRIKECVREEDTLSRLGGDEFTIILESTTNHVAQNAAVVSTKIIKTLKQPFYIRNNEIIIGCSIGIAIFPESGSKSEDLMRRADLAMYKAKSDGRNTYRFFTESMQHSVHESLRLQKELRHAVDEHEFELHYQAKVCARTGLVTGAEALLRWQDSNGDSINPELFISKLEEMGLISQVGDWVIETCCQQLQKWQKHQASKDVSIAVNLSMSQLMNTNLDASIKSYLDRYQVAPNLLELEITESMMMSNPQRTVEVLNKLHKIGVKIAIDDFGTGFSSLGYLQTLPLDTLKVDKTFSQNIGDPATNKIVRAIIGLAHNLGLQVIAEGVEQQHQLDYLVELNCELIQGYYYARPLPLTKFLMYLANHNNSKAEQ